MEYRQLGKTGMNVSVLGLGGWEIGYLHTSVSTVKKMLNEAIDAGVNVIDTAECYAISKELIETVGKRRKDFYLLTKCGHESGRSYPDWRPESLLRCIQRSLKRLKTDHLDLIQLHSCSEVELRKGAVIDTLKRARENGYTRHVGYSAPNTICYRMRRVRYVANIHQRHQPGGARAVSLAEKHNIGVIAKRPVANVAWQNGDRPPTDTYGRPYWERLQKLKYELLRGGLKRTVASALRLP